MARQRRKPGDKAGLEAAGAEASDAPVGDAAEACELLLRASKLIAEPSAWTRREFARDRHSHPVSPSSERAVRFCVSGALLRATSERFGVQFKLGAGDELWGEPWAPALGLAYRYLGNALVRFHLWANIESLHEELIGGIWRVKLTLQRTTLPTGEKTFEAPWSEFVHIFNDHRAVKHLNILMALVVAQAATFDELLLSAAKWPEEGRP